MRSILLISGYCLLVVAASLMGGRFPTLIRLTHSRMQLTLSLVGGLMLSISLFVLFAHSAEELESVDRAAWWTVLGMLAMFLLIRAFHFHQHDPVETVPAQECASRHEEHRHEHGHAGSSLSLSFVGVALGLGLHTLIDGIALAATVQAELLEDSQSALLGFGTFLAIVLHKPLDALSITSVMAGGGWSRRSQSIANVSFALMCPLGAALFLLSLDWLITDQQLIVGRALGFSAGAFLCIALGDLLPEVQFHAHDRLKLSSMLLLGVIIGYAVSRLDPPHEESTGHHAHQQTLESEDAH